MDGGGIKERSSTIVGTDQEHDLSASEDDGFGMASIIAKRGSSYAANSRMETGLG